VICSQVLSVAEDGNLNVFDARKGKFSEKFEFQNELYAIASNSIDKIALGGEEKKVDIYSLSRGSTGLSDQDF
jgi:hypothetical protein